jgi:hypothetical protein
MFVLCSTSPNLEHVSDIRCASSATVDNAPLWKNLKRTKGFWGLRLASNDARAQSMEPSLRHPRAHGDYSGSVRPLRRISVSTWASLSRHIRAAFGLRPIPGRSDDVICRLANSSRSRTPSSVSPRRSCSHLSIIRLRDMTTIVPRHTGTNAHSCSQAGRFSYPRIMDGATTSSDVLAAVVTAGAAAFGWVVWRYYDKVFRQIANTWATRDLDAPLSPYLSRASKRARWAWLAVTILFTVLALVALLGVIVNTILFGFH